MTFQPNMSPTRIAAMRAVIATDSNILIDGPTATLLLDTFEAKPDWSQVPANLFTPTGKWKYEVMLDYSGMVVRDPVEGYKLGPDPETGRWLDPARAAQLALAQATRNGTSGVTISNLNGYWTLVVFEPPNGWPICVHGQRDEV